MGNEPSNQMCDWTGNIQKLIRKNKHFTNDPIHNLTKQKLHQLLQELQIHASSLLTHKQPFINQFLLNLMVFNEDFSFQKISHRLAWRMGSDYPHIFNIKKIKIEEHKNLCSLSRKIYVAQDGYDFTLKDLIKEKSQNKESFAEDQILTVLSKVTEAIIWIHDNEFKNIPLDTESIVFIKNQDTKQASNEANFSYQCKIIDQDIVQTNSYKQFLESLTQVNYQPQSQQKKLNLLIYLSPQLLQEAKSHNYYPTSLTLKTDIFTLGMMMMELCCQEEMYFCYDLDNLTFDYESLIHRIAKISYSNELKLLLAEMLEYDQNNRIGFVSLKEKLQKLIFKPFQAPRKLKRRSSSTMLKQLLSCSRASASVQNKQPSQKNGLSRISTLSRSNKRVEENKKLDQSSNKHQSTQQSLRKSNSLVNLKCRTNSFLTSKKPTLVRVNSNTKLQTENRKSNLNEVSIEVSRVDYHNIIKNRLKTETKTLQCPQGQNRDRSQDLNGFKFEELQTRKFEDLQRRPSQREQAKIRVEENKAQEIQTNRMLNVETQNKQDQKEATTQSENLGMMSKARQVSKFSYVQKKVINLDKINISSSKSVKALKHAQCKDSLKQKVQAQKSSDRNNLTSQSDPKINNKRQLTKKQVKKQSELSVIKALNLKQTQQNSCKIEEKDFSGSSKNWIMGKLKKGKADQPKKTQITISTLFAKKDKSSSKNKQSALTKPKTVSLIKTQNSSSSQMQNTNPNLPNKNSTQQNMLKYTINSSKTTNHLPQTQQLSQPFSTQWNKNDTIIKRLQLTEQKTSQSSEKPQIREITSNLNTNIQTQMQLVDKVLEKCSLSSSRWQQDTQQFQNQVNLKGYQTQRKSNQKIQGLPPSVNPATNQDSKSISSIKQHTNNTSKQCNYEKRSQFKKKSKIIDIDLGTFSNQKSIQVKQNSQAQSNKCAFKREDKKPSSKLQKLKQLTIFTEQTAFNDGEVKEHIIAIKDEVENEDKQNKMQNSNLQQISSANSTAKINELIENIKRPKNTQFCHQNNPVLGYNPFQRTQHVSLAMAEPCLITPINLNDLNRVYGKGRTLQSVEQSLTQTLNTKDFSTLSKPFQQIELYYTQPEPHISSPNIPKNTFQSIKNNTQTQSLPKDSQQLQKSNTFSSLKKDNCLFSINTQELTFRLKPKISDTKNQQSHTRVQPSKLQKVNFFQKQDGSFILREQNPLKHIQTSSIVGQQDRSKLGQRNTVEELFEQCQKFQNYGQSGYKGYRESFSSQNEEYSEEMNSSCNSINLSQIQQRGQRSASFIFQQGENPNQKQRKYKHVSILQDAQEFNERSRDLSFKIKNIRQITQRDEQKQLQTNLQAEYDTYRRYLSSNQHTSIVQISPNFLYEGHLNHHGEFQGNGMIYKLNHSTGLNDLIFTGSFLNGLYHGFGTLYQIELPQQKKLKLPNYPKRISFGAQDNQLQSYQNDKYFSLSYLPIKYEGQFSNGQENGFGTYTYQNGDKFSGCIKDGVVEGYGTYHFCQNGQSISGIWKNGTYTDC